MSKQNPLGKNVEYPASYDASLLHPIARADKRTEIGIGAELPFFGTDVWNAYEISWLNPKGKPVVAMLQLYIPCESDNIVESKSLKLYLGSFNQTPFESSKIVMKTIQDDLRAVIGRPLGIKLIPANHFSDFKLTELPGQNIDYLDIETSCYQPDPELLKTRDKDVTEMLMSNLLKSNCPVTNQPDWGSVLVHYEGKQIDHRSLLKYIVSYRQHDEFHEQCVERMYMDIMQQCKPSKLTVFACYTRRGGLDINPFRSNFENPPAHFRTHRQ